MYEFVQGVTISNCVWTIESPYDDSTRKVTAGSTSGCISQMALETGDSGYFDMVPTAVVTNDSYDTYYAADAYLQGSSDYVLARSYYSSGSGGGVACSSAAHSSSYTYLFYGSRLAFRGTITEETNVTSFLNLLDGGDL